MSEVDRYTDIIKAGGAALGIENGDDQPVRVNQEAFDQIGREISAAENDIVLVSSFAIAHGMAEAGVTTRPGDEEIPELQRLAAIGQPLVQRAWSEAIPGKTTAELLLTREEIDDEFRRREILRTLQTFFSHGDVPVANENDAISHEEISFGSNDILSALLAMAMQRSGNFDQVRLFMLTDVNGVYADKDDPDTRIPVITGQELSRYEGVAQDSDSQFTIGGMKSKFKAASIAVYSQIPTYIYNPADGPREAAIAGDIGTYFPIWEAHNP
jgi:glutamate 5-kinase